MTGFEPLIGIGTAALTGLVTEIVKTRGSKLADQIDRDLLKPRLQQAIRNYIQNYEKRHGELKVACVRMDQPRRCKSCFGRRVAGSAKLTANSPDCRWPIRPII